MTREEFLISLYLMYKEKFNDDNIPIWSRAYKVILKENWNYELLFNLFVRNYEKTNIAPAPSYFIQFKSRVEPTKTVETSKEEKEEYTPPPEYMKDLYKKLQKSINKRSIKNG